MSATPLTHVYAEVRCLLDAAAVGLSCIMGRDGMRLGFGVQSVCVHEHVMSLCSCSARHASTTIMNFLP